MITMRAKFAVQTVQVFKGDKDQTTQETLTMSAVSRADGYPPDGSDEDNTYARWTPCGSLSLSIANSNLFGKCAVGQKFYLDFTPAP